MRFDPPLPSTSSGRPSRSTTVGDIMLGSRRPGGCWWKPKRVQILLAEHVVEVNPGAGDDDPRALAVGEVTRAGPAVARRARRCAWSTRAGPERSRTQSTSPSRNSGVRSRLRRLHDLDEPLGGGRDVAVALEQLERVARSGSTRRRRRVGQHVAAAVAARTGSRGDDAVGGEVLGVSSPPRSASQSAIAAPAMSPGRTGAAPSAPRRSSASASSGCAERVARAQHAARGRVDGRALGRRRSRSRRGSRPRRPARGSAARPRGPGARPGAVQSAERQRAEAREASPDARRHAVARRTEAGPMLKTWSASPKETLIGMSSAPAPGVGAAAGRLDEEVEQRPARPRGRRRACSRRRPGRSGSGSATNEVSTPPARGVDGVAARAQDVGAGLRGARVAGGDDAAHGRQPAGMNSGTSSSATPRFRRRRRALALARARLTRGSRARSRGARARRVRRTRGSPAGSSSGVPRGRRRRSRWPPRSPTPGRRASRRPSRRR